MANPLALQEDDLKLMLAAQVHIGSENSNAHMEKYKEYLKQYSFFHEIAKTVGIHLVNIGKTWEKLMLAARIIVAIENPEDVVAISGTQMGQRAVYKFAQNTGCSYIAGRYTPGMFTNQIQKKFMEPRLLIVTDPFVDHQPVKEAAYANIPVIALCDTNSPVRYVDVAIPCNNKSKHSLALIYWMLSREINRMRRVIPRSEPWSVMVDLFIYRDPEEEDKKAADEDAAAIADEAAAAEAKEKKAAAAFTAETGNFADMKESTEALPEKVEATGTATTDTYADTWGGAANANPESSWADSTPVNRQ